MGGIEIYNNKFHASCYFRTIADFNHNKCLIQITEKCNMKCEHCFVSANSGGIEMNMEQFKYRVIPNLLRNRFSKVTITGGEPLVHPSVLDILKILNNNGIETAICTNAVLISDNFVDSVIKLGNVHFNVSLDGFRAESHGKFRGNCNKKTFETIISNIELLGKNQLLKGILVTPNDYADLQEYVQICEFAKKCTAKYVLINPLSQFGRGSTNLELGYNDEKMMQLKECTQKYDDDDFEVTYIRFPNADTKPLGGCVAGKITYIFANGEVAFCPYMVFAADNQNNEYNRQDFILGNIFDETFDIGHALKKYRFPATSSEVCVECNREDCQKGCYASKIAKGMKLTSRDELCPMNQKERED